MGKIILGRRNRKHKNGNEFEEFKLLAVRKKTTVAGKGVEDSPIELFGMNVPSLFIQSQTA